MKKQLHKGINKNPEALYIKVHYVHFYAYLCQY